MDRSTTRTRRGHWPRRVLVALSVLVGVAITGHPVAATVVTDRRLTQNAATFDREAAARPDAAARLQDARAYNKTLDSRTLDDPWSDEAVTGTEGHDNYRHTLDSGSAMGSVAIPAIGAHLPIVHGTTPDALRDAVGHFSGSSLPIGGKGTHAVLAGHSGFSQGSLFDRLPEVEVGDEFVVRVLGRTLTYRVDQVTEVLPDDLERIRPVPGRDLVTLVTCTPRGVNTHRLLVRGQRVGDNETMATSSQRAAGLDLTVQDWMMPRLVIVGVALAALASMMLGWIISDRRRRRRERA